MSHAEGRATSPPGSAAGVLRQIARCHGETGRNVARGGSRDLTAGLGGRRLATDRAVSR
jgi:hypothetical protein